MKTLLLFALLATTGSFAQNPSAKAPPKKRVNKTTQSARPAAVRTTAAPANTLVKPGSGARPASSATTSSPSTAPRGNRTDLPQTTTVQPQPTPAPVTTTQRRAKTTSQPPVRIARSGGYGFHNGDKLLNIGVGLSSYYYGNPIGLSYEVGITDDISVGGQFDYNSGRYDDYYGYNYRYRYSAYYLGARGSFHFDRVLNLNQKKVDLYAGLGIGYQSFKWNDSYYGNGYGYNYGSGIFLNYFIGGKYYFTNKVGAFLELGYTGLSTSRVGLAVKF
jgi:hypothetical protein